MTCRAEAHSAHGCWFVSRSFRVVSLVVRVPDRVGAGRSTLITRPVQGEHLTGRDPMPMEVRPRRQCWWRSPHSRASCSRQFGHYAQPSITSSPIKVPPRGRSRPSWSICVGIYRWWRSDRRAYCWWNPRPNIAPARPTSSNTSYRSTRRRSSPTSSTSQIVYKTLPSRSHRCCSRIPRSSLNSYNSR